jgi:hypothetical protein
VKALPLADFIRRPLVRSQRAAETNAQQAMIALAVRRWERDEVDRYLADKLAAPQADRPGDRPS